ncbi:hypothetical protein NQ318_015002 [Aromia moschata]|uniref:Uncharacterized protein n=1 Tax=Aromia moschata TaxID=1265417 RepID=A0AAV8YZN3_9CUCU|nr:hypothetical protein NQ318_015002 [Aromia moschata]
MDFDTLCDPRGSRQIWKERDGGEKGEKNDGAGPELEKVRDVKRPKTIRAPDGPRRQKRMKTFGKLIHEDRRLSVRGLAEITGIDKECVRQILHESLNMRRICAKMVPKLLTPEQKESRMNICADILNNIDTDPGLLDTVTLKGTRFESVEAVKAKATEVPNQLTEADFQHCFQQWKSRMERCRDRARGWRGPEKDGEKNASATLHDGAERATETERTRERQKGTSWRARRRRRGASKKFVENGKPDAFRQERPESNEDVIVEWRFACRQWEEE